MNEYLRSSSGYFTAQEEDSLEDTSTDEIVLKDEEYINEEPRRYLEILCFHLVDYIASAYKAVARNLVLSEYVIDRIEKDYRYRGESNREICYQLLLEWLKNHTCMGE